MYTFDKKIKRIKTTIDDIKYDLDNMKYVYLLLNK